MLILDVVAVITAATPTPSPAPTPAGGGAPGWTAIATLIVGVLTFVGVFVTGFAAVANTRATNGQKEVSDRREAWWKRMQWAMDKCGDTNPISRAVGLTALLRLGRHSMCTQEDHVMLLEVGIAVSVTLAAEPTET